VSDPESEIAWMRRNPDPKYWSKAGGRILLDALTATENARDIALGSGHRFAVRFGEACDLLGEARHYLFHSSFCRFAEDMRVAPDPTTAKGQCDCGFDVIVDKIEALFTDTVVMHGEQPWTSLPREDALAATRTYQWSESQGHYHRMESGIRWCTEPHEGHNG
jgi:hypothetical protein